VLGVCGLCVCVCVCLCVCVCMYVPIFDLKSKQQMTSHTSKQQHKNSECGMIMLLNIYIHTHAHTHTCFEAKMPLIIPATRPASVILLGCVLGNKRATGSITRSFTSRMARSNMVCVCVCVCVCVYVCACPQSVKTIKQKYNNFNGSAINNCPFN